jgi:hypothetical protein
MGVAANFRLPGCYFLPAQQPQAVDLPPLDVAGFIGFATRGPLDVAVPVNDLASFDAIFGGPLAVARDATGSLVTGNLRGAVAGFFSAGGTRCYCVRVGGAGASAARFVLPGLVAIDSTGVPAAATIDASSPGAWGASLSLGAIETITLLPPAGCRVEGPTKLRWAQPPAAAGLQQGDVLRIGFDSEPGKIWLFPVETLSARGTPNTLDLSARSVWPVLTSLSAHALPAIAAVLRLGIGAPENLPIQAWFTPSDSGITLGATAHGPFNPIAANNLLVIACTGGTRYLLTVADTQAVPPAGSLPSETLLISAVELLCLSGGAGGFALPAGGSINQIALLRMNLQLGLAAASTRLLQDLGFNTGQARFWGDIAVAESGSLAGGSANASGTTQARLTQTLAPGDATQIYDAIFGATRADLDWTDTRLTTVVATLLAPVRGTTATFLPLGLPAIGGQLAGPDPTAAGDDSMPSFDPSLFVDPGLAGLITTPDVLAATAADLAFVQNVKLKGMFALMFVDEVALISVPDAVQTGWSIEAALTSPQTVVTVMPTAQPGFIPCQAAPALLSVDPAGGPVGGGTAVTLSGSGFDASTTVSFGGISAPVQAPAGATKLSCTAPQGKAPGSVAVTVSNGIGSASIAAGYTYWVAPTVPPLPLLLPLAGYTAAGMLSIQAALIGLCNARRDAVAILSLPLNYRSADCAAWLQALREAVGLPMQGISPDYAASAIDLSYAAVYHPWLVLANPAVPSGATVTVPPDGAACGLIAAREIARQVWVAPANMPIPAVVDLQPDFSRDDWATLFLQGFNLVRAEATDFRVMSAHTLSDDSTKLQLSVRRLLIQLRKAVLELGQDYVFDRNDDAFQQRVQHALLDLLRLMYASGAFAGASQQASYQVVIDTRANSPVAARGEFIAQILVAPSQPMEFITVTLSRTGAGQLLTAGG